MEKIRLGALPRKKSSQGSTGLYGIHHDPLILTMAFNGADVYSFSGDIDRVEKMIEWLYDNTTERFTFLGTENIYFESSEDAMAFKLRWT